eukprot:gene11196-7770_t
MENCTRKKLQKGRRYSKKEKKKDKDNEKKHQMKDFKEKKRTRREKYSQRANWWCVPCIYIYIYIYIVNVWMDETGNQQKRKCNNSTHARIKAHLSVISALSASFSLFVLLSLLVTVNSDSCCFLLFFFVLLLSVSYFTLISFLFSLSLSLSLSFSFMRLECGRRETLQLRQNNLEGTNEKYLTDRGGKGEK